MKFSKEAFSDKKLSRLVIGSLGRTPEDLQTHFNFFDEALECGYNTIDTALAYNSEQTIGAWMESRGNREEIVIISKGAHPSRIRTRVTPFDIESDLHESLAGLKTDYIDLYLLHRDDESRPVKEIVDLLNRFYREGKVRAFGGSNWTADRIRQANEYAAANGLQGFASSSPNFSLAYQAEEPWAPGCISISGPDEAAQRDFYLKTQMPVLAYSSLARGLFSGRITRELYEQHPEQIDEPCRIAYCNEENFKRLDRVIELSTKYGASVAQIALAFVLNSGLNVYPIVGAANKAEMMNNIDALDLNLTESEIRYLDLRSDTL